MVRYSDSTSHHGLSTLKAGCWSVNCLNSATGIILPTKKRQLVRIVHISSSKTADLIWNCWLISGHRTYIISLFPPLCINRWDTSSAKHIWKICPDLQPNTFYSICARLQCPLSHLYGQWWCWFAITGDAGQRYWRDGYPWELRLLNWEYTKRKITSKSRPALRHFHSWYVYEDSSSRWSYLEAEPWQLDFILIRMKHFTTRPRSFFSLRRVGRRSLIQWCLT